MLSEYKLLNKTERDNMHLESLTNKKKTMNIKIYLPFILIIFISQILIGQNIGIGVENPTEKLEVDGVIYSKTGGFRFPDSTIQNSAVHANSIVDAAKDRNIILMEIQINGADIDGPYSDDNFINVFEVIDWEMNLERDLTNGYGGLIRAPFSLVKNIDGKSTEITIGLAQSSSCNVILHLMSVNNESLVEYFTVYLNNAKISQVKEYMLYKGNGNFAHLEKIFFWPQQVVLEDPSSGESSVIEF